MSRLGDTIRFERDETWLEWARANPHGFALNIRFKHSPSYAVLHRATCLSIVSSKASPGAYCERKYRKIGAETIELLSDWSRRHGRPDGSFSRRCGKCKA